MISRAAYRKGFGPVIGYDLKPSKGPVIVFSTLNTCTAAEMSEEMEILASRSKRVEKPCAHFCFSLAPGEKLSPEQWADFFAAVADEFGAMQAVGITHADTPQVNAHLVLNRVRFDGRAWSNSNDRKRLRSVCGTYERKFGLRILPEQSDAPRVNKTEIEKADRLYRQGKAPTPIPARMTLAETVRAVLAQSRTPDDFTKQLGGHGITVRWRMEKGAIVGTSYAHGDVIISGKNAGISVRAVREQFSTYEHDRITTPGSPAPALASDPEGAATHRADSAEHRTGRNTRRNRPAERQYRKVDRDYAHDSGGVAATARQPALTEILGEAGRYGCLGLLGLLNMVLASVDGGSQQRQQRPRRIHPSIPMPS